MMKRLLPLIGLALLLVSAGAHAELSNSGLLTDIANRYQSAASSWASYIMARATWMYWVLVMISMVWTGGMMAIKGAGIQEFFAEFVRFIMFTGFFWWLLVSAPTFVPGIYSSMATIGSTASGLGSDLRPSGIVDIGFMVLNSVLDNSSLWEPIDSLFGFIMAVVILLVLSLTAVNMVVLLVSGWVVGYAGIIYLGFGGSRWTSEMAISFYKTVLGIAIQLMTMILLVGIGKTFLDDYYARMATGIELKEMAVLMVASLVLLILVNKVPQLMSSIASSNVGMSGLGSYGSGTALAAAGMAGAAAAGAAAGVGASMMAAGAANIAGGASAIKAAFSQASANVSSGSDVMAKAAGAASGGGSSSGASGGGSGGGGAGTASTTPFAQVAGLNSTGGGASVSSIAGRSNSGGSDASGGGAASSSSTGGAAGGSSSGAVDGGTGTGEAPSSSSASSAGEGGQSLAGSTSSAPATSESPLAADPGTSSAGSSGDSGVSQAQSGQAGGDGGASSIGGRAASAAAKAGRVAADAGANLAMGTWDVAKAAVASRMEQFGERIAETTGGKVAQAIHERGAASAETPTFSGDGFAAAPAQPAAQESTDPEVAAFVKRGNGA